MASDDLKLYPLWPAITGSMLLRPVYPDSNSPHYISVTQLAAYIGGGGGSSGLSGMTPGQIPIAATDSTVTSSANLSGDITSNSSLVTTLATVNSNVGTFNGITVNAKGLVTAASSQGYITANQTITLSGDLTGSGTTAITGTLATVNSNVGTFQGITVNGKGLVTAAADQGYAQKIGATFTGKIITVASATGTAGLGLPHGAAPTSPVNGDIWTTTSGTFVRINGATVGPLIASTGATFTGEVITVASTTGTAGLNIPHGAAPTSPVNGDTWTTTAGLFVRINGATVGPLGGAGSTGMSGMTAGQIPIAASATTVTSSANLSGDITSNSSLATTLATVNSNVGTFQGITVNGKGLVTAASDQAYAQKAGATFTGEIITVASATGTAGLNIPHGAAPTSPVNGDTWTTTAGLFVRINGATVGPLGASSSGLSGMTAGQIPIAATATTITSSGNLSGDITTSGSLATTLATVNSNVGTFQGITVNGKGLVTAAADQGYAQKAGATFTGELITLASATGTAGFNIPHGAAPTSPVNGDVWTTTAGLFVRVNGATVGPYLAIPAGTAGDILYNNAGTWSAQRPRWAAAAYAPGVPTATQTLLLHRAAKAVTIPINFGAYLGMQSQAGGSVNATASTVMTVAKAANATPNTFSTAGTITFAAGSVTPTFATTGGTTITLAQGDVLRIQGPGTADATFADFYCTIVGFET